MNWTCLTTVDVKQQWTKLAYYCGGNSELNLPTHPKHEFLFRPYVWEPCLPTWNLSSLLGLTCVVFRFNMWKSSGTVKRQKGDLPYPPETWVPHWALRFNMWRSSGTRDRRVTMPTHLKREFPVGPSGSICGGLQVQERRVICLPTWNVSSLLGLQVQYVEVFRYKRQESDMPTHLKHEFPAGPAGSTCGGLQVQETGGWPCLPTWNMSSPLGLQVQTAEVFRYKRQEGDLAYPPETWVPHWAPSPPRLLLPCLCPSLSFQLFWGALFLPFSSSALAPENNTSCAWWHFINTTKDGLLPEVTQAPSVEAFNIFPHLPCPLNKPNCWSAQLTTPTPFPAPTTSSQTYHTPSILPLPLIAIRINTLSHFTSNSDPDSLLVDSVILIRTQDDKHLFTVCE